MGHTTSPSAPPRARGDDNTFAGRARVVVSIHARERGQIVVTLDADFHAQLALTGAASPSVIRIRIEGVRAEEFADLLTRVIEHCVEDLQQGALVTVTESGLRLRRLPLIR